MCLGETLQASCHRGISSFSRGTNHHSVLLFHEYRVLSAFGPLYSPFLLSAVCPALPTADTFYPPPLELSFLIPREAFHGNPFVATLKLNSLPRACIPDAAKPGMLTSLCQSLGGQP